MKRLRKIGVVFIVLALALGIVFVLKNRGDSVTKDGLTYLDKQESKDTKKIEKQIREQLKTRVQEAAQSGDGAIWGYFSDVVIMGDSRPYGFMSYEFLPSDQILCGPGDTIRKIEEHWEELKKLNPQYVVLSYGINDVSIGFWPEPDLYVAEYTEIINKMKTDLPDTKIYINSILPATEAGIAREGSWANIPSYNTALKKMCKDLEIGYIDVTDLANSHLDLYNDDGVHVASTFYPLWAGVIMSTIYGG